MEKWSGWSWLADREGFIVIYPEGIGILGFLQHWNAGYFCGKAVEDNWNDVAFIEAAIDGTCRQYAVDKHRIYMIGFSNGGMMTEASWTDSNGGNEMRVCRIVNFGHEWPGETFTRALPEDHPLKNLDAAGIIWRFFRQYPKE
jgi:poly(3-hydroxybutyrate) depolymerase